VPVRIQTNTVLCGLIAAAGVFTSVSAAASAHAGAASAQAGAASDQAGAADSQKGAADIHTSAGYSELDPVVVTASRTERLLSDAPVRAEVISAAELNKTHARSLTEALQNVPGLQLRRIHGKSGYEAVLQGMTSDQVLVLVDGLPLATSTGSTVDLSQLALVDVERIEVVKGAASAQYGSSAMGGVINVITRAPENGVRGSLTYDLGSYGGQNISGRSRDIARNHIGADIEGGRGAWSGRLSADVRDDKGFDADHDNWVRQGDESKRSQYEAQLRWRAPSAPQNYLSASVQRFDEKDVQWLAPEIVDRYPNKYEDIQRDRLTLMSGWQFGSARLTTKILAEDYQSKSAKQNEGFAATFDNRDMYLDTRLLSLQLDMPLNTEHQLQIGLDARDEKLKQYLDGEAEIGRSGSADRQNYEFYIQDDYFFSPKGELVFGLRLQEDSDFGSYLSPKLALRYDLFNQGGYETVWRSSMGTGYRVPNLKERYYTFDHSSLGYMVLGNPDLDPESSVSYQSGIWLRTPADTIVDINVFYNDIDDLIQTDEDNFAVVDGLAIYTYENISNARTYGIESALIQPLGSKLKLNLGHTYTHAENSDTGDELTRRPQHIARLGLDWQLTAATEISTRVRYQSRELSDSEDDTWSPAWTTVDLKLNYQASQNIALFGGIDNLTDRQRDFTDGTDFGPVEGRFVYAGTRIHY